MTNPFRAQVMTAQSQMVEAHGILLRDPNNTEAADKFQHAMNTVKRIATIEKTYELSQALNQEPPPTVARIREIKRIAKELLDEIQST